MAINIADLFSVDPMMAQLGSPRAPTMADALSTPQSTPEDLMQALLQPGQLPGPVAPQPLSTRQKVLGTLADFFAGGARGLGAPAPIGAIDKLQQRRRQEADRQTAVNMAQYNRQEQAKARELGIRLDQGREDRAVAREAGIREDQKKFQVSERKAREAFETETQLTREAFQSKMQQDTAAAAKELVKLRAELASGPDPEAKKVVRREIMSSINDIKANLGAYLAEKTPEALREEFEFLMEGYDEDERTFGAYLWAIYVEPAMQMATQPKPKTIMDAAGDPRTVAGSTLFKAVPQFGAASAAADILPSALLEYLTSPRQVPAQQPPAPSFDFGAPPLPTQTSQTPPAPSLASLIDPNLAAEGQRQIAEINRLIAQGMTAREALAAVGK